MTIERTSSRFSVVHRAAHLYPKAQVVATCPGHWFQIRGYRQEESRKSSRKAENGLQLHEAERINQGKMKR